jgi:hypothetical protein
MSPRPLATVAPFLLAAALAGCTKDPLLDPKLPGPVEPTQKVEEKLAEGSLSREKVDRVLREGPGWLLDKVPVEEVITGGKFVGWRVRELPAEWSGGDIKPGDVVTRVNGLTLERPDDYWAAWTTMTVASELKIDYLRGDMPKVLSMPIVGMPDPRVSATVQRRAPAPEERTRDKRFDTITIEGEPTSLEPTVDWTTKQ